MNYIELVQTMFTDANDEEAESLLYGGTSFPFGVPKWSHDPDMSADDWYLYQLREVYEASGGDVAKAFEVIDTRMEEGMREFREKYPEP